MKTRQDPSTKPYYRCLSCARFRKNCGGRPTRDMDLKEWCEYIRDIKEYFHLSNSYITEKAQASSKTTEKIMAINTDQDIMRATARRYERAVIGPVGEFSCYTENDQTAEIIQHLRDQVEFLRKENDRKAKIIDKFLG